MMYLIKYTLWKSITFPFSLTTQEYECQQTQPFEDNGRHFNTLLVQTQKRTPYGRMMSLFFSQNNLLERTDYETQDEQPVLFTKINSDYKVFDGIKVPTNILIYHRQADGTYDPGNPLIGFEVKSLKFI